MKKHIFLLLFALVFCQTSYSQKNVASLHLTPIALIGEIGVSFEHEITDRFSVVANLGIRPKTAVPPFIGIDGSTANYNVAYETEAPTLKRYNFVPEFRFYMNSKDQPKGFYIAPYLRFSKFITEFQTTFEYEFTQEEYNALDESIKPHVSAGNKLDVNTDVDVSLGQVGLGVQFGVQWLIADMISIDYYFLGIEYDRYKLGVEASSKDAEELGIDYTKWEEELNSEFEGSNDDTPLDVTYDLEVETDKITAIAETFAPWFRMGLKVGYAF